MKLFGLALVAFVAACTSSQPPAASAPAPASASAEPTSAPSPSDAGGPLTAAQCKAAGGEVVGDIGDGAIHRPGYKCPSSGKPPVGHIAAEPGGPMAIEGAVCCK